MKWRAAAAAAATVVLVGLAVGYTVLGGTRDPAVSDISLAGPGLLVRDTGTGRLAIVDTHGVRALSSLECARTYAAGGTGVCLRTDPLAPTGFEIAVLDSRLRVQREIPLVGVPSRARVSASGRMVSVTVFVTGDSYNGGRFSTRSAILDTRTGDLAATLEEFTVTVDGKPQAVPDANFWGVSFASDDNTFYATMSTRGHHYLVEGDFATRTVRTVYDNVECPSLSPDGRRVAFKKRVSEDPASMWRLTVLDLTTMVETPLAETRSVDDQAAWIDDNTIAYAIARQRSADVWSVPADGSGVPTVLAPDAESPAALHGPGEPDTRY